MELSPLPRPDRRDLLSLLGYGQTRPDPATEAALSRAEDTVRTVARPRYIYRIFALGRQPLSLLPTGPVLSGEDIARHLSGCHSCAVLILTLGPGVERAIRAAGAADAAMGLMTDAAASALTEACADAAETILRREVAEQGLYLTGRFSPGYGDLPLSLQPELLRITGSARAIGLTVSPSHILLPRKSITALLGLAHHPVTGHLAGCEGCAIKESCQKRQRGEPCHGMDPT